MYLLTDDGLQFVSRFFADVITDLEIKHSMTTAYHPHTKGHVEKYNRTIVARPQHYFAEHHIN